MTNNNNQCYIPKLPETNTIAYFDINEWNKSLTKEQLNQQERLTNIYESEYQDKVLNGSQYGPGNEKLQKNLASLGIGAGLIATTIICPPLGAAVTTTYGATGLGMKIVGEMTDNEGLAEAGEVISVGATIGGIGGGIVTGMTGGGHGCIACKTSSGRQIWTLRK